MKVGIIGCGNIGLLYAKSFNHYKICKKEDLYLFDKSEERKEYLSSLGLGTISSVENTRDVSSCDLLIFAVKPQDFASLSKSLWSKIRKEQIILSIMAGIKIERIAQELNHENIVRAMPNTPSLVGMGATVYTAHSNVNTQDVRAIENMLSTTGRTFYVDDEDLLDAVTALSGSGPAYFFYFVKNMIDAGTEMGLDEAMSAMLVKQTMLGSFQLLNNAEKNADELIASVKSKGGTTEAALLHFDASGFDKILKAAISKAHIRAKELSR
jgi:pyrroline-5-carboxylate reductase